MLFLSLEARHGMGPRKNSSNRVVVKQASHHRRINNLTDVLTWAATALDPVSRPRYALYSKPILAMKYDAACVALPTYHSTWS